jgi:hypothetical protein
MLFDGQTRLLIPRNQMFSAIKPSSLGQATVFVISAVLLGTEATAVYPTKTL